MTVYDTPFYDEDYCLELVTEGEENVPLCKRFSTSSADIAKHRKVKLQDTKTREQLKQKFKEL